MKRMVLLLLLCAITGISCSEQTSDLNYSKGGGTWLSETDGFLTGVTYHGDPDGEIRVIFIKHFTGSSLPSIQSSLKKTENNSFIYQINDSALSVEGDLSVIIMGNETGPLKASIERGQISAFLSKLKDGTYKEDDVINLYNEYGKPKDPS